MANRDSLACELACPLGGSSTRSSTCGHQGRRVCSTTASRRDFLLGVPPRHSRLISSRYRASTESRTSLNTLRTLCVSVAQVKCAKRRRAREPFLPPSWGSAQFAYTRAYMSKMKRLAASASRRGPAERAWGRMGFVL